jgi:hypothetical protein
MVVLLDDMPVPPELLSNAVNGMVIVNALTPSSFDAPPHFSLGMTHD